MRLLVFLLAALLAPAQGAVQFVPLGVQDGLASRKVYQAVQDGDGYLWFYTQNSIDRYDGFEFRHYELGPESREGNFQATSNTLSLAPDGTVHVVQTNGRIYRYSKGSDSFERAFSVFPTSVYALLFTDGDTWLGTSRGLVSLYEDASFLPDRTVTCLARQNGKIYAGTDAGLYELSGGTVRRLEGCPQVQVTAVLALDDGRLFAGTFADGVFCIDSSTGVRLPFATGFPNVPVRKIAKDSDRLLFATDGAGVVVYDLNTSGISDIYTSGDSDDSLCANTVSDIFVDSDGILWVTTTTDGICFSDPALRPPQWLRHVPGMSNSLPSSHVNSVMEDSSGRIWFGTNKGLCRWENGEWRTFNTPGADVILMTAEDGSGNVWVGGYGFPLFCVDTRDRIKVLDQRRFHYTFSLEVSDGCLWIGDIEDPLTCIDLTDGTEKTFDESEIWDLYHSDGIWVASHTGLGTVPPGGNSIRWIPLPEGVSGSWCITSDASGRIWAGMENGGIVCYNPSDGTSVNYPLPGTVFDILADDSGAIWAVSDERIYRLDPSRGVPVVMNHFLGIESGEFNHTAAARLSDGRFVFGTAGGAIVFDPSDVDEARMRPVAPVLTSFRLLSGSNADVLKGRVIDSVDRLRLRWVNRSFAISYSAKELRGHANILFEYMMEGYESDPHTSLSAETVVYDRLPAGRYRFTVKAIDALTGSVLGEKALPITIRRPVTLSLVAMALYVVLLSVFTYLFIRYRRSRKSRQLAQERLDNFIRFAHELKTPVSLIKAPLAALDKDPTLSEQNREPVSTALRNADRLMDMINGLLDLRQDNAGLRQLQLEPVDLEDYVGETLNSFLPLARHKGLDLSYTVAPGLENVLLDREKMDLIIRNLVSNAVKYTQTGSVTVSAEPAGRSWKLQVKDTGIGIPAEVRSRIFYGGIRAANARNVDETGYGIGLMICRQLVLAHKGSISLDSEEGAGTTFTLSFPLEYKASAGTVLEHQDQEADVSEAPPEGARACILIVEDDAEMLRYLRELLLADYDIKTASDGAAATAIAEEEQPDLVLSDVIMSGMNGFDLCRHLKSTLSTSHIPVILLTAMDDKEHVIMGLEAGADDYILKPFDPQVLKARLSNLLHERERLRELVLSSGRREKQREYTNKLDREFMEKVLAVMEESYSNPEFQVDDLCRAVAMSRTALFNKLKALSGKGPNDFIRIYRLDKAKKLLESGEYTIAEVADEVGFSDAKYFSSCFKRAFGVSPSKY